VDCGTNQLEVNLGTVFPFYLWVQVLYVTITIQSMNPGTVCFHSTCEFRHCVLPLPFCLWVQALCRTILPVQRRHIWVWMCAFCLSSVVNSFQSYWFIYLSATGNTIMQRSTRIILDCSPLKCHRWEIIMCFRALGLDLLAVGFMMYEHCL